MPDSYLPFGGKLDPENRWMKLAKIVPWDLAEQDYRANFADSGMGAPAKESRIALGALIIKERLGVTDEKTVAQIRKNAYLQHFLGLHEFLRKDLFDPSMMVHFRKRIRPETLEQINLAIISRARSQAVPPQDPPASPPDETPSAGQAPGGDPKTGGRTQRQAHHRRHLHPRRHHLSHRLQAAQRCA